MKFFEWFFRTDKHKQAIDDHMDAWRLHRHALKDAHYERVREFSKERLTPVTTLIEETRKELDDAIRASNGPLIVEIDQRIEVLNKELERRQREVERFDYMGLEQVGYECHQWASDNLPDCLRGNQS